MIYRLLADTGLPILRFELAGSAAKAAELADGRVEAFRDALLADYPFILAYTTTLVLSCLYGWGRGRTGITGAALAVAAAVCDAVENLLLWQGLDERTDTLFARAALAASVKFALLVPAVVLAVWGLCRRPAPDGG
ncbi:hypothetical protein [Actinocorallia lasiicapitis]